MKRKGLALFAVAAAAALLLVLLPAGAAIAGGGGKAKTYKSKVGDDYFSPTTLKIKKGDSVKWKWLDTNGDSHNVTLKKGPGGVKKKQFTSATGSVGIKFKPTFKKPGTYKFICTIHPTVMQETVKVKK